MNADKVPSAYTNRIEAYNSVESSPRGILLMSAVSELKNGIVGIVRQTFSSAGLTFMGSIGV